MPEMQLADLHNVEASVYVATVMFSPNRTHAEIQRGVDAVRNQALADVLNRNPGAKPLNPAAMEMLIEAAKGDRIADYDRIIGPAMRTRHGLHRGLMAAKLFVVALAFVEHDPSNVSKEAAYKMWLKAATRAKVPDHGRITLLNAFSDFEPVAHLWAAATLEPKLFQDRSKGGAELAEFLGLAERLRQKGESVRLDKGFLLDPTKTWKAPARFTLPAWEIPLPSPAMLAESMSRW